MTHGVSLSENAGRGCTALGRRWCRSVRCVLRTLCRSCAAPRGSQRLGVRSGGPLGEGGRVKRPLSALELSERGQRA